MVKKPEAASLWASVMGNVKGNEALKNPKGMEHSRIVDAQGWKEKQKSEGPQ